MKKKESEFAGTLDKLDTEVQRLNQNKAIVSRRRRKIEVLQEQKKEAKEKFQEMELEQAKKGSTRDKLGIIVSIMIVAAVIIVPYYRKDPVNFWFYVIVGLCYFSFYVFKKYS